MNTTKVLFSLLVGLCVLATPLAAEESEKKKVTKLQIGVKKRVEGCERKSRKGDLLHMHYTVMF